MLDEVYALGLRNPHRFSWAEDGSGDPRIIISDIGQDYVEEINVIEPSGNFGWREREGTFVNQNGGAGIGIGPGFGSDVLPADDWQLNDFIYPAAQYGHPTPGRAVAVVGDRIDVQFGQGHDGELYIMNKRNEWIYLATNTVPSSLDGDYDDSGDVGSDDLNLVLFNWNADGSSLPAEWVNQISTAGSPVGITELNEVLFNWGNSSVTAAVPEPGALVLGMSGLVWAVCRRHFSKGHRRHLSKGRNRPNLG